MAWFALLSVFAVCPWGSRLAISAWCTWLAVRSIFAGCRYLVAFRICEPLSIQSPVVDSVCVFSYADGWCVAILAVGAVLTVLARGAGCSICTVLAVVYSYSSSF